MVNHFWIPDLSGRLLYCIRFSQILRSNYFLSYFSFVSGTCIFNDDYDGHTWWHSYSSVPGNKVTYTVTFDGYDIYRWLNGDEFRKYDNSFKYTIIQSEREKDKLSLVELIYVSIQITIVKSEFNF